MCKRLWERIAGFLTVIQASREGVGELSLVLRCSLSRAGGDSEENREKAMSVLNAGARAALAFGVISFVMGMIAVLSNLSDPSRVGPAVAMTLMSALYAVALAELVFRGLGIQCARKFQPGVVPQFGPPNSGRLMSCGSYDFRTKIFP